ncbi:biotin-protein ligase [Lipomyces chichibuensis]|uniref:biotin-protein ligase n=1 Tax=Lipomyces chichibuensis TaxID=1546026 RepID=UPI003343FFF6
MNVLIYAGPGTTVESVAQCTTTLRSLLSPNYAVLTIDSPTLINEPWPPTTSLVVVPGGADLPYCRTLNGPGNSKITSFVRGGGAYLGFCAGGYYGSSRVEFEENDPSYAVVGRRELAFYPGINRGTAFPGFIYDSESGARAAKIKAITEELPSLKIDESNPHIEEGSEFEFASYYNGGGVFVDADSFKDKNVTVLARYAEEVKVEGGDAAVVHIKVGAGAAILTGPHPEFSPRRLRKTDPQLPPFYGDLVQKLIADNPRRLAFMKSILIKLGLKVNVNVTEDSPPLPTTLHLTSGYQVDIASLWSTIKSVKGLLEKDTQDQNQKKLKLVGENDTFLFAESSDSPFDLREVAAQVPSAETNEIPNDLNKVFKDVVVYHGDKTWMPTLNQTPHFDHALYYNELIPPNSPRQTFGSTILYGEVVTSTSTMLDRNLSLLRHLPTGFTAVGTVQVAGRGRGGNVWVSPIGLLAFSIVIRHPLAIQAVAPVVFVQYIASLAIVEAIRTYGPGYDELDIRLKWPNDVYARNPAYDEAVAEGITPLPAKYLKIAGILVNSNFADNEYLLVVGCGINTANEAPTTSLNTLVAAANVKRRREVRQALEPFKIERLFAKVMWVFERMYNIFKMQGFHAFEDMYYARWLHTDAIVRLEMYGGTRAKIKGISMDYGMLVVEEVSVDGVSTGKSFTLQPDGNSFDMLKGLLKKKQGV